MKVLARSDFESSWFGQFRCTGEGNMNEGCNSLLEVEYSDLRYFPEKNYSWRVQPAAVCFKCPCCGNLTDLGQADWPNDYQKLKRWTKEWQQAKPETA